MSEGLLQAKCIARVQHRGGYVVKIHQTGRGRRGIPDLLWCYRSYFVATEIKVPGGHTQLSRREAQAREMRAVQGAGGIAMIVTTPAGMDEIMDWIDHQLASGMRNVQPLRGNFIQATVVPLYPSDVA